MKTNVRSSSASMRQKKLLWLAVCLCSILTLSSRGAPQTIGTTFSGATLADTGAFPPDSMGAVGPSQSLVTLNGRIRSFNKTTGLADGIFDATTDDFFGPMMTPVAGNVIFNFTTDPRVRYDRMTSRWIIMMIDVPVTDFDPFTTAPNRIMIAVSDAASAGVISANTVWQPFVFQQDLAPPAGDTGRFADYPTLGVDVNALYIGCNMFTAAGAFAATSAFVVRKTSILGTGPIVVTAFRNLTGTVGGAGPQTPQGVDNFDPAATQGYFIGVNNASLTSLVLRRVTNPGGTPTISANIVVTTAATSQPHTVPHLGNTGGVNGNLDAVDRRLFNAVIRDGRLWTSHNIYVNNTGTTTGTQTRNGIRWYELQNLGTTPTVRQSDTVYDPTLPNDTLRRNYFFPAIMVSAQGHVAIGFSTAGANERINVGIVGRLAGDALNTMQAPLLYTASTTAYNPPDDPGGTSGRRWGDYSYTCVDPDDDMTMWTIQEFCNATDSYAVQVARLLAPPPATPASASPTSVSAGSANANVTVVGTSVAGSGFFDPGAGFARRIAATVNGGGVTVNSVTYTDPTHVTLNITIAAGAPVGARTITVTNPDGQSTTSSSGILTVVPSVSIAVIDNIAWEDPNPPTDDFGKFRISRTGDTSSPLQVYFTTGGTAIGPSPSMDYWLLPNCCSVTIPAGSSYADVTVEAWWDGYSDPGETVIVTLSPNAAYSIGAPNSGTVYIYD